MKIVLVGNSDGGVGSNCGTLIDSFDMIIRFNCFILNHLYYKDFGSRTTHCALNSTPEELSLWCEYFGRVEDFSSNNTNSEYLNSHIKNKNYIITRSPWTFINNHGYNKNSFATINSLECVNQFPIYTNIGFSDLFNYEYFNKNRSPSEKLRSILNNKYNIKYEEDNHILSSGLFYLLSILELYPDADVYIHSMFDGGTSHYWDSTFSNCPKHFHELEVQYINKLINFGIIKRLL
jgi:hypothetical protein